MGPSAVDLPDPLDHNEDPPPLAPLSLDSADDLISQFAGDEINRLMRDDRPPPVLELRAPGEDAVLDEAIVEQEPVSALDPHDEERADSNETSLRDDAESELAPEAEPEVEEESDLARELAEDERIHGRLDEARLEEVTENIRYQLDELLAEVDLTPVPFMAAKAEKVGESESAASAAPVYLTPLVWLNAPLTRLPARARTAVGVLSVTLFVVALGALGYVIFLRQTTQM